MKYFRNILFLIFALLFSTSVVAGSSKEGEPLNVGEFILHHVADAYEWHIAQIGSYDITVPLPVIVRGETSGWHVFSSNKLKHEHKYKGFYVSHEGDFSGKIVELDAAGNEIRPLDLSFTKNALALVICCTLLIVIFMTTARSFKKKPLESKRGLVGLMEILILDITNGIIKPCIGKTYRKHAPYLLTLFFFIFLNNVLGLIPIFPGGANITGNIAITFFLALITFLIVNIGGSKEYWREILWPDVPIWLKVPPIMPVIELVGIFTKPFALMIRLFANILAGHALVLGLTCIIFIAAESMNAIACGSMTVISVFFSVFISFVELLVAYFQAYIFTLLSAVFIGLARVEPHHHKDNKTQDKAIEIH